MRQVFNYIQLMRVTHWSKNFFIFIPTFFNGSFFNISSFINSFAAFFCFSLTSSCIYIINDYFDIEKDKNHPVKSQRPLASGEVSNKEAFVLLLSLLMCIAFLLTTQIIELIGIILIYFFMNLAYSIRLKKISILDIGIISIGFLLRIFAGAEVNDIIASKWLILMTFLLSMLLALAKRRDDVIMKDNTGIVRDSLRGYNLNFINSSIAIMGSATIVTYIMYTVSPEVTQRIGNDYVYLTSIIVIFGLLRYLQITLIDEKSGSPTHILINDRTIQLCILAWLFVFYILLYHFK